MRCFVIVRAVCVVAALVTGCASPPARFYKLSTATLPAAAPSQLAVAVGPVSVPAIVDRPQIVVSTGPNEVRVEEFNRWASPLQDNISRVVTENLVVMLGTPHVTQFPQELSTDPDIRVVIGVQRFDSAPGDAASLDAVWSVRRTKDGKSEAGRTSVREPVRDTSWEALVAAHSRAIARLSQDVANAISALAGSGR